MLAASTLNPSGMGLHGRLDNRPPPDQSLHWATVGMHTLDGSGVEPTYPSTIIQHQLQRPTPYPPYVPYPSAPHPLPGDIYNPPTALEGL